MLMEMEDWCEVRARLFPSVVWFGSGIGVIMWWFRQGWDSNLVISTITAIGSIHELTGNSINVTSPKLRVADVERVWDVMRCWLKNVHLHIYKHDKRNVQGLVWSRPVLSLHRHTHLFSRARLILDVKSGSFACIMQWTGRCHAANLQCRSGLATPDPRDLYLDFIYPFNQANLLLQPLSFTHFACLIIPRCLPQSSRPQIQSPYASPGATHACIIFMIPIPAI